MGVFCDQSPRLNASKTSSEDIYLNHTMDFSYENLNLFRSDNQDDFATSEEDNDLATLVTNSFNDKNNSCVVAKCNIHCKITPSTPKKAMLANKNLVAPFPMSKRVPKSSSLKVVSSHS